MRIILTTQRRKQVARFVENNVMPRKFLQYILKLLSNAVLWRYRPLVIGITGNVGKTSTKEAIYAVLKSKFRVRKSIKNYNNEIGIPLTILGTERAYGKNIIGWLMLFVKTALHLMVKNGFPEILILEMGLDRPGDIRYLMDFIKPAIGVVTAIGEIPVHVEFFPGPASIAREKRILVERLPADGKAILNFDDEAVRTMRERTKAKIFTFGFGKDADLRVINYELRVNEEGVPEGISFKVDYQGSVVPVRLNNVFGKQQVYAALAAIAVGISLDMHLVELSQALGEYVSPPGRMKLVRGIKESWIVDDTYNAAPLSTMAALETLKEIPAKRKIAVLGDMLEIGKYTVEAHQAIGEEASKIADIIFTVGLRAKFIYDEVRVRKFAAKNIFHFNESQEAGLPLQKLIEPGDLILVKGSRAMKMEKVVEEVMADPKSGQYLLPS